jgi:hypothetical protein
MTETPKTKLHINPDKINYFPGYKLNPEKLVGASSSILPFLIGAFYYTEDYEHFDKVKPYLDIPEPRKSLEEIKQELDEKFEKLIETTKWKFAYSKEGAEKRYNTKFDKIFDNFEYAKRNGYFLQYLSFTTSGNASIGNGIVPNSYLTVGSGGAEWTSNFVIKPNAIGVGYYQISSNIQFWMKEKPNFIVRNCAKILLGLIWKDA